MKQNKYPKITFRPTKEMSELFERVKKSTGLSTSEVMRNIISDYIVFLKKEDKKK